MSNLLKQFTLADDFIGRYEKLVKDVVIPYQEKALRDEIEGAEKSHAIENFKAAAIKLKDGHYDEGFYGMVFQDSDVAKWLEAAAYSLLKYPDELLEKRCDDVINIVGQAQHDDGYLNTYFTVKEPEKRWTNLEEGHELYCAGHMIEAAVAYTEATGKNNLLDIVNRLVNHIHDRFIVQGFAGYPGHPEIELALMRLYKFTGDLKSKQLAEHFVNVRGVDSDYFIKESEQYPWTVWGNDCKDKEYTQNFAPVREQKKAVGHAVRAAYLYSGMADVALETNDETLKNACKTLWQNIVQARMYITGGIGSAYEGEAFTKDYHLPNDTAYAEGCAAISLIFFAQRMLRLEIQSEYADIMERALYNCVLADMQLDGKRFFYVNPLEVIPGISGEAVTHKHALPQRPKWFACACCPPNVARLLSSIGDYAWSIKNSTLYSHLYISGTLELKDIADGKIKVETAYPYGDTVNYSFETSEETMSLRLAIRIPEWSSKTEILLNGEVIQCDIANGYAIINRNFRSTDKLAVKFDMSVRSIYASEKVSANSGKVAFSRGPLVYCAEGIDNNDQILDLYVKKDFNYEETLHAQFDDVIKVELDGYRRSKSDSLYSYSRPDYKPCKINLVPYYTWGNRGLTQMRVWLPEA